MIRPRYIPFATFLFLWVKAFFDVVTGLQNLCVQCVYNPYIIQQNAPLFQAYDIARLQKLKN